jgi:hypothetical protein
LCCWRFRSLRKRKVLSAARKKVPKKAVVPLVLSVLL